MRFERTRECERKWKDVPKTMHILKIPRLCWGVWSIDVTRVTVGLKLKIEIIERQTESMLGRVLWRSMILCMIHHACIVPHIYESVCVCVCSAIRFDFRCTASHTQQTMRRMRWNERIRTTKTKTNQNNNSNNASNKTKQNRDSTKHTNAHTHTRKCVVIIKYI